MILGTITVKAKSLQCDVCGYPVGHERPWHSIGVRLPEQCPNRYCRSREWNGKKKKRKPASGPKITLPKPVKVRPLDESL
jgi:hypothetical protein